MVFVLSRFDILEVETLTSLNLTVFGDEDVIVNGTVEGRAGNVLPVFRARFEKFMNYASFGCDSITW